MVSAALAVLQPATSLYVKSQPLTGNGRSIVKLRDSLFLIGDTVMLLTNSMRCVFVSPYRV